MTRNNVFKNVMHISRNLWTRQKLDFGKYKVVEPMTVTEIRRIPDNIVKPSYYQSGQPTNNPEVVEIKSKEQIECMRESCRLAARILKEIGNSIKVGITTDKVDEFAHSLIIENNAYPSPLNYKSFPKSLCTSVNNVACHGIPDLRALEDGDIINIDITVFYNGYHGDCSKTFLVGNVDDFGKKLVEATEICLYEGISACKPGQKFSEIGYRIERKAKNLGYNVVPCFIGHGIGSYFHGPPDICHFANNYPGVMYAGMTFTIEPVLSQGSPEIIILDDGWTAVTEDNARTAQCEHTILITETGVEILTLCD